MARKTKSFALRTWEEVNECLREICECKITIEDIGCDYKRRETDLKAERDELTNPLEKRIKELKQSIEDFAFCRKGDLNGKSKFMTFGVVGFRKSTKISFSTARSQEIIGMLKEYDMFDCINTTETVKREALKQYPDDLLNDMGVKRITEDSFYCETDQEKIR